MRYKSYLLAAVLMLSSCNLFESQLDTIPPPNAIILTPDIFMANPDTFLNLPINVRGYVHYSGDNPNMARLVSSREMVLAPPPEAVSLWVLVEEFDDLRACHGEYIEVVGFVRIEKLKENDSDGFYVSRPILRVLDNLYWFEEVPSAFENPVPDPSEFEAVKAEGLALRENDRVVTCATFIDSKAAE